MERSILAYNGERLDWASGATHLGNGYRAYNPVLMRFHCPDNFSPFGSSGINPYVYCAGDPINRSDPSGHLSWHAITGIVLGGLGLALAVFTAGSSILAAGSVALAYETASAASLVTGGAGMFADLSAIASGATEEVDPKASAILGWVSLAGGVAGAGAGILGVRSLSRTFRGLPERLDNLMDVEPSGSGAARRWIDPFGAANPRAANDEIVGLRGKQIIVRSSRMADEPKATKVIVASHGRFQVGRYLTRTYEARIPDGMTVNFYVRHGERMSESEAYDVYSYLQGIMRKGWEYSPVRTYANRTIKNYTLRLDENVYENFLVQSGSPYDLVMPREVMSTSALLEVLATRGYREVHFLGCRATPRLTASGWI